jgi:uncharacterized protein YbjT (DUF2867 family)
MKKTALIFGSTGLVGSHLLSILLNSGKYSNIISLSRKRSNIHHELLTEHIIDFNALETFKDIIFADHVFCCIGTTRKKTPDKKMYRDVDYGIPMKIALLALANGAETFSLVSAQGANGTSRFFYYRVKGDLENDLIQSAYKTVIILRPSLILGNRSEKRILEKISIKITKAIFNTFKGFLKNLQPNEASSIARLMFDSAQTKSNGRFIYSAKEIRTAYT